MYSVLRFSDTAKPDVSVGTESTGAFGYLPAAIQTFVIRVRGPGGCHLAEYLSCNIQADARVVLQEGEDADLGMARLRLVLARQLVELMGGELQVASHPEEGTAFTVALSLEAVNLKSVARSQDNAQGRQRLGLLRGFRYLLAEDNPVTQKVMSAMLTGMGAEVVIVDNGAMAIEAVQEYSFDAVLMDCQMPVMDGLRPPKTSANGSRKGTSRHSDHRRHGPLRTRRPGKVRRCGDGWVSFKACQWTSVGRGPQGAPDRRSLGGLAWL